MSNSSERPCAGYEPNVWEIDYPQDVRITDMTFYEKVDMSNRRLSQLKNETILEWLERTQCPPSYQKIFWEDGSVDFYSVKFGYHYREQAPDLSDCGNSEHNNVEYIGGREFHNIDGDMIAVGYQSALVLASKF